MNRLETNTETLPAHSNHTIGMSYRILPLLSLAIADLAYRYLYLRNEWKKKESLGTTTYRGDVRGMLINY